MKSPGLLSTRRYDTGTGLGSGLTKRTSPPGPGGAGFGSGLGSGFGPPGGGPPGFTGGGPSCGTGAPGPDATVADCGCAGHINRPRTTPATPHAATPAPP